MLDSQQDNVSISDKIQTMIDSYINCKMESEMQNYNEYKKVYDHILKLPMVSQSLEGGASKVNTYMTKKIVDLNREVSRLNKELDLLKQKLSLYENTEQNQNIRLEIKDSSQNNIEDHQEQITSNNIYSELTHTEENIVKRVEESNNNINIEEPNILESEYDIKTIKFDQPEDDNTEGEDEEEEVEEMEIEGSTYYVTDKVNGTIYEMLPEEDVGDKLGEIKDGKAFFY
jgi:hypothetical protein